MVDQEIDAILHFVQEHSVHLIIVSGEVGLGLVPDNALGRAFRDLLGWTNQKIAKQATATYFMLAGLPIELNSMASTIQDAASGLRSRLGRSVR
jgi:adenosylcobinamide kinase/adenosylcobinamide-phosphate guanylyltransferase